jgi:hypothetical protein
MVQEDSNSAYQCYCSCNNLGKLIHLKHFFSGIVFFFVSIYSFQIKAQVDYPAFKSKIEINPTDSEKLSFNLYNLNYVNNTEWFGNIPLSGTLFGYEIIPEMQYQISPRLIIKGGIYLQLAAAP